MDRSQEAAARARVRDLRGDCMQLEHVRHSGLHTQLFSAARHSVWLLHIVTQSSSLSTAHGAQCDLQFHLYTSRGHRVLDSAWRHLTLALSSSACVVCIKHTNPVYISVMAHSQACWHSLGLTLSLGESGHTTVIQCDRGICFSYPTAVSRLSKTCFL